MKRKQFACQLSSNANYVYTSFSLISFTDRKVASIMIIFMQVMTEFRARYETDESALLLHLFYSVV